MRRVDFFIAGVQKGGTTALDSYLRRHSAIQMAGVKEVHHFDDEKNVDWDAPSHDRLHTHFDWARAGVRRGEATPIYTYWPRAIERVKNYNPDAHLIVGLRHPVYRAYSHWKMEVTRGADTLSFEEAVGLQGRQRVEAAPGGVHRVYSYIERGYYAAQVERVLAHFPREQVHFLRTDALWHDTPATLSGIEAFLDVPHELGCDAGPEYIVPLKPGSVGSLDDAPLRARLAALFARDIDQTQTLTGLDLGDWLSPAYAEPMAAA